MKEIVPLIVAIILSYFIIVSAWTLIIITGVGGIIYLIGKHYCDKVKLWLHNLFN